MVTSSHEALVCYVPEPGLDLKDAVSVLMDSQSAAGQAQRLLGSVMEPQGVGCRARWAQRAAASR